MAWQEGYVTEVPYTVGFYSHLTPFNIELCLLHNGIFSPNWRDGFTYCELACGRGLTTLILAAVYPQGQFYAMDFNAAHIAEARLFARDLGLTNIHFSDCSFREYLDETNLPPFDYISLHGIYSWITPANRYCITDFIKKYLNVGGVASVSYNVLPGWSMTAPIQHLIDLYQRNEVAGDIFTRLDQSQDLLKKLRENQAVFFNSQINARIDSIFQNNRNYLVHEYFNADWHPMYVDQVMSEMEAAKLSFAGSGIIIENIPGFCLTVDAYNHISSLANPKLQQLLKDYYINASFRRDIYVRGSVNMTFERQKSLIDQLSLFPLVPRSEMKFEFSQGMLQSVSLLPDLHNQFLDMIFGGTHSACAIFDVLLAAGYNYYQCKTALFGFIGLGYISPVIDVSGNFTAQKFNALILERFNVENQIKFLAVPRLGTGVYVEPLNIMFLQWHMQGCLGTVADYVINILDSQNLSLSDDAGNRLTEQDAKIALVNQKYAKFAEFKLPLLVSLEVVAPPPNFQKEVLPVQSAVSLP